MTLLASIILVLVIFHFVGKFLFQFLIKLAYTQAKQKHNKRRPQGSINIEDIPENINMSKCFYENIDHQFFRN